MRFIFCLIKLIFLNYEKKRIYKRQEYIKSQFLT